MGSERTAYAKATSWNLVCDSSLRCSGALSVGWLASERTAAFELAFRVYECSELGGRILREEESKGEHTRMVLQRSFAIRRLDLICGCGLLDAKDSVWLNGRLFSIINKIFGVLDLERLTISRHVVWLLLWMWL
jgi:hypothetical protein